MDYQQSNIKVCVRVRPFNDREKQKDSVNVINMYKTSTIITNPQTLSFPEENQQKQAFNYDHSFWSFDNETHPLVTQEEVFETIGKPIVKNIFDGYNSCIIAYGQTGCLDPDTEVLLYSGKTIKAKNIKVGDQLMGDDSKPRQVLQLFQGKSRMYKIESSSGRNYKVNKDHVLSLLWDPQPRLEWSVEKNAHVVYWHQGTFVKYFSDKTLAWNYCEKLKQEKKIIDIPIQSFIKKPIWWKKLCQEYTPVVEYPEIDLPLDPYILGVWLTSDHQLSLKSNPITSNNPLKLNTIICKKKAIIQKIQNITNSNNNINNINNDPSTVNIKNNDIGHYYYELNQIEYDWEKKTIPSIYLINTVEKRKQLLAGIMDNGVRISMKRNAFYINTRCEFLCDQIIMLCRSIGLDAIKKVMRIKSQSTTSTTSSSSPPMYRVYRCYILTPNEQVQNTLNPYLIPDLIIKKTNKQQYSITKTQGSILSNPFHKQISIKNCHLGFYCGFLVDSNHRFMLANYTATHNSGKSFSMMGGKSPADKGLIPRICYQLFQQENNNNNNSNLLLSLPQLTDDFHLSASTSISSPTPTPTPTFPINSPTTDLIKEIEISYLEIYAEQIHDLLDYSKVNLRVREHPETGPYVENLTQIKVDNFEQIDHYMNIGNQQRITAPTKMNEQSSRSHAVFIIYVTQKYAQTKEVYTRSKLCLVDLAGSERVKDSGVTGINLKEASDINTSLTVLGRVISMLSKCSTQTDPQHKPSFVPFRESVLTWLLRDALGGNSKTVMLAAISPSNINYDETLNTLHYASRTKQIVNKVNINAEKTDALMVKLKQDLQVLKDQLQKITVTLEEPQQLDFILPEKLVDNCLTDWEQQLEKYEQLSGFAFASERKKNLLSLSFESKNYHFYAPYFLNLNKNIDDGFLLYYPLRQNVNEPLLSIPVTVLWETPTTEEKFIIKLLSKEDTPKNILSKVHINGKPMDQDNIILNHGDMISYPHYEQCKPLHTIKLKLVIPFTWMKD
jgi:hypothetical protein